MSIKTRMNPMGSLGVKYYTLTVITSPSTATCYLTYNGVSYNTKTLTVRAGSTVSYSVSYNGYNSSSGSWVINSNVIEPVSLSKYSVTESITEKSSNTSLTISVPGNYKIECVGWGGTNTSVQQSVINEYYATSSSGSGAGYCATWYLTSGKTVALAIDSNGTATVKVDGTTIITCTQGGNAQGGPVGQFVVAPAGTITVNTSSLPSGCSVASTSTSSNGNNGATRVGSYTSTGGASVYEGYGMGAAVTSGNVNNGIVRITYVD